SGRPQERNHLGTVLGRSEAAIRLHVVAGHNLIRFRDEAIELLLVPYKVRALHGAGIAVVLEGTGFPSDNIVEVRTQAIVAFLGRVAGPACVVECLLPRLGGGALSRRLLGQGRGNQQHQECGADQSRDCGAEHKCSCRLNERSQRFVPVIPARCLATVWAPGPARPSPCGKVRELLRTAGACAWCPVSKSAAGFQERMPYGLFVPEVACLSPNAKPWPNTAALSASHW